MISTSLSDLNTNKAAIYQEQELIANQLENIGKVHEIAKNIHDASAVEPLIMIYRKLCSNLHKTLNIKYFISNEEEK